MSYEAKILNQKIFIFKIEKLCTEHCRSE